MYQNNNVSYGKHIPILHIRHEHLKRMTTCQSHNFNSAVIKLLGFPV